MIIPASDIMVAQRPGAVWSKETRDAERQEKAFQDFESMFAHMILKEMRKTINDSSMVEKSHATKMYEEMMDEALAQQMGGSGQLGIADQLRSTLDSERIRVKNVANEKIMTRGALEPIKE